MPANTWLGQIFFIDEERMLLDCLISLRAGERIDEPRAISLGLLALGLVFTLSGANRIARRYMTKALEHAQAANDPAAIGVALFMYGWLQCNEQTWDAAIKTLERAAEKYVNAGDVLGWGGPTAFLCYFRQHRGELEEVARLASELQRLGRDARVPHLDCWGARPVGAPVWPSDHYRKLRLI